MRFGFFKAFHILGSVAARANVKWVFRFLIWCFLRKKITQSRTQQLIQYGKESSNVLAMSNEALTHLKFGKNDVDYTNKVHDTIKHKI